MKKIPLSELHQYLLISLIAFDGYCRSHDIHYSLCGGTLIGAVRHHGFIPWDDDVDVMMLRSEYDKLTEAWLRDPAPGYTLLTNHTPNNAYAGESGKWYNNDTAPLHPSNDYDLGFFMDIFIADNLPDAPQEAEQYFHHLHQLGKHFHSANKRLHNPIWNLIFTCMPFLHPRHFYKKIEEMISLYSKKDTHFIAFILGACYPFECERHPKSFFNHYTELTFEGHLLPVISEYDAYLRQYHGDYMQLPPEKDRVPHHTKNQFFKN